MSSQQVEFLDFVAQDAESSQPVEPLEAFFKPELAEADEESKKESMKRYFDIAYDGLKSDLNGLNRENFLVSLEIEVYKRGDLEQYYENLAKLDALYWLDRHQNELLKLKLPPTIELSIDYQFSAEPETLITFYNDATRLLKPPKTPGVRGREQDSKPGKKQGIKKSKLQKEPSGAPASVEKSEPQQEPLGAPASLDQDDFQKEAVKSNAKTTQENFGKTGLKYSKRSQEWITQNGSERFSFPRPITISLRNLIAIGKRKNKGKIEIISQDDTGTYLDRVFGVNRIVLSTKASKNKERTEYFQTQEDLDQYQTASRYWEEKVKGKSGTARVNWNPANPGVQLTDRAWHTPYSAATKEGLDQTYHYVRTDGELASATKQGEDAPKISAGEATSSDMDS